MNKGLLIGLIAGILVLALGGGITAAVVTTAVQKDAEKKQVEQEPEIIREAPQKEVETLPTPTPVQEPETPEAPAEETKQGKLTPEMARAYLDAISRYGHEYEAFALMNIDANGIPQLCMLHDGYSLSIFSVDENGNLLDYNKDGTPDDEQSVFGLGTYSRSVYSTAYSGKIVSWQTGTGGAGEWYNIYSLDQNGINLIWMGGYDALMDAQGGFVLDGNGEVIFDDPIVGRMQTSREEYEKELNANLPSGGEELALSEGGGDYMSKQEMVDYLESIVLDREHVESSLK